MIFVVIALFLLLAAFFDAAEIALVSTNRYRVKHLAEKGWPGAVALMKALSNPMLLPGTTLVGVNLSVVTASSAAALWALHHFGHWRGDVPRRQARHRSWPLHLSSSVVRAWNRKHRHRATCWTALLRPRRSQQSARSRQLAILFTCSQALPGNTMNSRLPPRVYGAAGGSLQDSAFPGRSLGTSQTSNFKLQTSQNHAKPSSFVS